MKGLYIVTPDWDETEKLVVATEAALKGGAALVQYRHKTASPELRKEQAGKLLALCRQYNRPLIINDHIELALELGAEGIHVGGTDASVAEARKRVGPGMIVGASCYDSLDRARMSHEAGASYIAFGGFYPSRVKKYDFKTPYDIVTRAKEQIPLPVVVIGGMTPDNAVPLIEAGTDMVAAISAVYMTDDPQASAQAFIERF